MNRWAVLALLFGARTVMAMQFQLVGTLSPTLETVFSISTVQIGFAIGLYFAPGLVFAIPGGAIARRYGEGRIASLGLWLMVLGGVVMALAGTWPVFLAGQVVAGTGGIIVNVLMTKMVADLFRDGDLALALSVFLNSWPMGIALSLVMLPTVSGLLGLSFAVALIALLAAIFAVILPLTYQSRNTSISSSFQRLNRRDLSFALSTGVVWGCFNAGVGIVFSFGTALLTDTGLSPEAAARQTSLVLWALALVAPFGGFLSDRFNRPERLIAIGLSGLAVLILLAGLLNGHWLVLVLIGCFAALVAGPAMSLPARSLSEEGKAVGMGVFFTLYYLAFLAAPPLAAWVAEAQNTLQAVFWVGAAIECIALIGLAFYLRQTRENG
ncbi:MAG: MFS transporter [Pseudomonadota bacterium]